MEKSRVTGRNERIHLLKNIYTSWKQTCRHHDRYWGSQNLTMFIGEYDRKNSQKVIERNVSFFQNTHFSSITAPYRGLHMCGCTLSHTHTHTHTSKHTSTHKCLYAIRKLCLHNTRQYILSGLLQWVRG